MSFDLKKTRKMPVAEPANELYIGDHVEDAQENDKSEMPEEFHHSLSENAGQILHSWQAPEFEVYEKSRRWYAIAVLFIFAIVVYALMTNSPIMAITFILLGIVGYIYAQKNPRIITFSITDKGVVADKDLYLYENINSFWIFYEPTHTKAISLHTKASMLPFVHIPIGDENPVELREVLMQNIAEIRQDPSLINTIERVLHL